MGDDDMQGAIPWPTWRLEHLLALMEQVSCFPLDLWPLRSLQYFKHLLVDMAMEPPGDDRRISSAAEKLLGHEPLRGA